MEFFDEFLGAGLPCGSPGLCALPADLVLDLIEPADAQQRLGRDWRIAALVVGSESVLTAPGHGINALRTRDDVVGIDLFSPLFPSISNHPLLFGLTPGLPVWLRTALGAFV